MGTVMRATSLSLSLSLSLSACASAAPRGTEHATDDACTRDDECTIVLVPCCTPCAPWTLDEVEGVLAARADARRAAHCPEPTTCPQCVAFPPSASLHATCRRGTCVAVDDGR